MVPRTDPTRDTILEEMSCGMTLEQTTTRSTFNRYALVTLLSADQTCRIRHYESQKEALQKFSEMSWSDIHAVFKIEFTSCVNADPDKVCRNSKVQ